jgi:alkanesulfonate monooxygenase SsuD/methylene tetrahydromethanopterin reductase-like flavin-dependent oxidoreductase (luciferase family)
MGMKIGVQLPEVEYEIAFADLVAMARLAEQVGFDSIWLGDHLLYDLSVGSRIESRGPWEAWTSLAALAACTERVELGPLVASTSFHAPAMLAKMAATVDAISGGRLVLGLGAGWNRREYDAYGFPYDHRVSRFEEAFTVVRTLLVDGEIDFHGRYYDVDHAVLHPRSPRPGGPPIWVGSFRERMQTITLPYVQGWNVWWSDYGNTPEGFASLKATVDARLDALGRTGLVEATCAVYVRMPGGGGRLMGEYPTGDIRPIEGPPDEIADRLREFATAGAAHVQLVVDPIVPASIEQLGSVLALARGQ